MKCVSEEKRRSERYAYPSRIEYVLDGGSPFEVHDAVTIDISETGLSLYAFSPQLAEGQEIIITSKLPVEQRRAAIRWVRHEHDVMYKLGVKFINAEIRTGGIEGRA